MSTQHNGTQCQVDGKRKSHTVLYYNENKVGMDMLDSMCHAMPTKPGCRRWPLAIFYNILDLAGVNAWILYCKKTDNRISRRKFLVQLSAELRHKVQPEEDADEPPAPKERRVLQQTGELSSQKPLCAQPYSSFDAINITCLFVDNVLPNYVANASKDNVYFVLRVN